MPMEVIIPESEKSEEELDERVWKLFTEAINILGGLRKLIEYRNLTWLPSLAEACYVILLKNERMLTKEEIAKKLGISKQTVDKIVSAEEAKIESFLKGEIEKLDEHKAGALAKLAYKRMKEKEI